MTALELAVLVGSILAATAGFLYIVVRLSDLEAGAKQSPDIMDGVNPEVNKIFNQEFREELRNRGRLHFEKIIGENSMFLQQDLRLTASQMNEFMKKEISEKMQKEFKEYEQSIDDAKKLAVDSMSKTQQVIEQQRTAMVDQISKELQQEKARALKRFHDNMGEIVNHYLVGAIGNQIQLDDQLEFIISELENKKEDIVKDLQHGA